MAHAGGGLVAGAVARARSGPDARPIHLAAVAKRGSRRPIPNCWRAGLTSPNRRRRRSPLICVPIRISRSRRTAHRSRPTMASGGRSPGPSFRPPQLSARARPQTRTAAGEREERTRRSRCRSRRISSARCCSICATHSSDAAGESRARMCRGKIWPITTRCWTCAAIRLQAGDIAQVDMMRLDLQRVQVRIRSADRRSECAHREDSVAAAAERPHAGGSVRCHGHFRFRRNRRRWTSSARIALDARPDLRAAMQAVEKAKTDHQLAVSNGSTDPTFSVWWTHNGIIQQSRRVQYRGRQRQHSAAHLRSQSGREGAHRDRHPAQRAAGGGRATQVFSDVDSAYATLKATSLCCGLIETSI